MESLLYGNGVTVSYGYDEYNRKTSYSVNNVLKARYTYDVMSRLASVIDVANIGFDKENKIITIDGHSMTT